MLICKSGRRIHLHLKWKKIFKGSQQRLKNRNLNLNHSEHRIFRDTLEQKKQNNFDQVQCRILAFCYNVK